MSEYGTIAHVKEQLALADCAKTRDRELEFLRVALHSCEECPESKTKSDLLALIKAKMGN